MKERLKKERSRLFRRIILMMLGIFLIVSGVFCAVRLNFEKEFTKDKEASRFDEFADQFEQCKGEQHGMSEALSELSMNRDQADKPFNAQLVIWDKTNNTAKIDTANTIPVFYYLKSPQPMDYSYDFVYFLYYQPIRNALNDAQFEEIKNLLSTKRDDGNYYELICTEQYPSIYLIPLKLKIVLVNGKNPRFLIDPSVKEYDLKDKNRILGKANILKSHENYRNVIPTDFFLHGAPDNNYITKEKIDEITLSKQNNTPGELTRLGWFDYQFFSSKEVSIANLFNAEKLNCVVLYAKKVNLLDISKNDLLLGIAVIFLFFLTTAVISCMTSWKTTKIKLMTEQQKLNIFNALVHDVKTPLFVISGYAQCLKEDIDREERALYIEKIMEQADTANSLVCQMLDFSKLDSYNLTLHKTDFDLCELAEATLQNYTALPDRKTIVLTHSGDNTVNADKELIKTVLQNMTDNAVKYALPDSEIHITITGTACSVSNRTAPISKGELQQLQQPFVHKDRGNRQKGSGLGLSIVKSVLELHGAAFTINMKGDRFICSFKL